MKILPLAFALAVAAVLVWRGGRLGWPIRVAGASLSAALVLYGIGVVHPPELDALVGRLGSTLGAAAYPLVGAVAFLETGALVGLVVPGEAVVVLGGVIAGQGHADVVGLTAVTWACAFAGDMSGYVLGRRLGRPFLREHGFRIHITPARLAQVEQLFSRYGLATILIGRFVGLVRPLAPFLAGASRYPPARFAAAAAAGTGLWSTACVMLGFVFWHSLDEAIAIAKQGSLVIGVAALLTAATLLARRRLHARR